MLNKLKLFLWKYKIPLIIITILLAWHYHSDLVSLIALQQEKSQLRHFKSAVQISPEEFLKIESDTEITLAGFEHTLPAEVEESKYPYDTTVYDRISDTYYKYNTSLIKENSIDENFLYTQKYLKDIKTGLYESKELYLPIDQRFAYTGGLKCFSCGCSCYVDTVLLVANENYFLTISGKNFAMAPERQGVYLMSSKSDVWERLTPQISLGYGGFDSAEKDMAERKGLKIFDNGCSIAYKYKEEFYKLSVC